MKHFKEKFRVLFLLVCFLGLATLTTSCSNEVEEIEEIQFNQNAMPEELDIKAFQFEKFKLSVDSLNKEYGIMQSRGFWSGAAIPVADAAGRYIGTGFGKWLGGAVGAIGGNPGTVVFGMLAGRVVGGFLGQTLASGVAGMLCEEPNVRPILRINYVTQVKANLNIDVYATEKEDSLGFFHNTIMKNLKGRRLLYGFGEDFNPERIYDDVITYCQEYGYYDNVLENPYVKQAIINVLMNIANNAIDEEALASEEEYINRQANILASQCLLDEYEITQFREFDAPLAISCSQLTLLDLNSYANDLNQIIATADLSDEAKQDLALSAQIVINSTLCWKE